MPKKIVLVKAGLGTYTEPGTDVVWIRDSYTEPREAEFECDACGKPITEWELWTCMDGGEAAHLDCVRVRPLTVAERTEEARKRVCPKCHATADSKCFNYGGVNLRTRRSVQNPLKRMNGVHAERLALIGDGS